MKNYLIQNWLMLTFLLMAACSGNDPEAAPPSKTFVLVHGAFQASYVWQNVKTQLENDGQKVVVVELPAHGEDPAAPVSVSIDVYRDVVHKRKSIFITSKSVAFNLSFRKAIV